MSNAKIYNRTCFFNLPIAGMSHFVSKCQFLQYVDDTAIYTHCKIKNLKVAEQNPETELNELLTWYNETNLVFNSTKAKVMLIASKQMTCVHNRDEKIISICCENKHLEQVSQLKLLEITIDSLDCVNHINKIIKECFTTIPFHVTMQLVESLVLVS